MKYELCGHLYNLALNEYFSATKLSFSPGAEAQQVKKIA